MARKKKNQDETVSNGPWGRTKKVQTKKGVHYWAAMPLGNGKYQPAPERFPTLTAAKEWLRRKEYEVGKGILLLNDGANQPFSAWSDDWMAIRAERLRKKAGTTPITYGNYESLINCWVRPFEIWNTPIGKIDVPAIKKFQNDMQAQNLGLGRPRGRRLQQAEEYVSFILSYAVRQKAIAESPFKNERVVRDRTKYRRDRMDYTRDVIESFANAIEWNSEAIWIAAYAGLRSGEIWGLQIGSIHPKSNIVRITWSLTESADRNIPDDERVRPGVRKGLPKPQRLKTIDVPNFLMDRIVAYIERQRSHAKPSDWLFVDPNGLPVAHSTWYKTFFLPAAQRVGLDPDADFHTIRHFCGSYYLNLGYPPYTIQRMLDHTNEEMTRLYSHLMPGALAELHKRADAAHAESSDSSDSPRDNIVSLRGKAEEKNVRFD